jgi:hypothetical protein
MGEYKSLLQTLILERSQSVLIRLCKQLFTTEATAISSLNLKWLLKMTKMEEKLNTMLRIKPICPKF